MMPKLLRPQIAAEYVALAIDGGQPMKYASELLRRVIQITTAEYTMTAILLLFLIFSMASVLRSGLLIME
jgi:hypothetical protein